MGVLQERGLHFWPLRSPRLKLTNAQFADDEIEEKKITPLSDEYETAPAYDWNILTSSGTFKY